MMYTKRAKRSCVPNTQTKAGTAKNFKSAGQRLIGRPKKNWKEKTDVMKEFAA